MKNIIIFLFLLTGGIAISQDVQTVQVTAKGMAREEAKKTAERDAIEQVLGTYIESKSDVVNMMLAADAIKSNSQGYVKSTVISEGATPDGLYQVTINAEVSTKPFIEDAMTLAKRIGGLRFITIYDPTEKSDADKIIYGNAVDMMNSILADTGYRYIERRSFENLIGPTFQILGNNAPTASYIQKIAYLADAEFAIFIENINFDIQEKSISGVNFFEVKASVKVGTFDNCTNEGLGVELIITPANKVIRMQDKSEAMFVALKQALMNGNAAIFENFTSYMGQWIDGGSPFKLVFSPEMGGFRDLMPLIQKLKNDPQFGGQMTPNNRDGFALDCTFKYDAMDMGFQTLMYIMELPAIDAKKPDAKVYYGRQIIFAPTDVVLPEETEKQTIPQD